MVTDHTASRTGYRAGGMSDAKDLIALRHRPRSELSDDGCPQTRVILLKLITVKT